MMKSFKSDIVRKSSRRVAEQILLVESLDLSDRFLKFVIASKNSEYVVSILLATVEAHVTGSLFRSSKTDVVSETAIDTLEQPPVVIEEESVSESELPVPCFGAPQLVDAGAMHRAQECTTGTILELSSPHDVKQVQHIASICMPS